MTKTSLLGSLAAVDLAAGDLVDAVDVSDISMAASGTDKKITVDDFQAGANRVRPQGLVNAAVANQTGFAVDTYLVGSSIALPVARLQAKTLYKLRFNMVKTAAGTATPILIVRIGTAGTTADAARATLTFPVQTAVIDEGTFDLDVVFRTVGAGTAAVIQAWTRLTHRLSATGLAATTSPVVVATSAGFDSTLANTIIGVSFNGGASFAGTLSYLSAELSNLAP